MSTHFHSPRIRKVSKFNGQGSMSSSSSSSSSSATVPPKLPKAPLWPASQYTDSSGNVVQFPEDRQASFKGCPDSWILIFVRQKQCSEHMDMFNDCVRGKGGGVVGMAYRNFMQHVYDGVTFDAFSH